MMPTSWKTQYADWEEMVFVDREKAYGAYALRKRYPRHLLAGVSGALFLGLLLIAWPQMQRLWAAPVPTTTHRTVELSDPVLPPPPQDPMAQEVQPPPPPPEPPKLKQLASLIPDPAPEEEIDPEDDASIHTMDSLLAAPNVGLDNVEGRAEQALFTEVGMGEEDIPEVIVAPDIPRDNEFIVVEEEPVPLNLDAVQRAIEYPQMARDANIQGTVVLRILIDPQGRYQRHKVINSPHPLLTRSVEAQIEALQFSPAVQAGKPIYFWINVPFSFRTIR